MVKDREPEHMPDVDYDKKDPPMSVGTVYSAMDAFKIALTTHAVKYEFNYDIEKSDTWRYRANCSQQSVDAKVNLQTQRANTRIDIQSVPVDLTY